MAWIRPHGLRLDTCTRVDVIKLILGSRNHPNTSALPSLLLMLWALSRVIPYQQTLYR